MDDEEYVALLDILTGKIDFKDWPKKEKSQLRQRVYKTYMSGEYRVKEAKDPLNGLTTSCYHDQQFTHYC